VSARPIFSAQTEADHQPISVVVPTRDRPEALRRCLDALSAQTVADRLDVVVVDDGSSAPEAIAELVGRYGFARLVHGRGGGPASARNEGARRARGAIICFTDDDCQPLPDWAERLAEAVAEGADIVAGASISGGGPLADASEIVARAPAASPPAPGSDVSFSPSNNLACRRDVFAALPFDESYPHAAGEDREWCARATGAGYALRAAPSARVVHRQELTLRRFIAQQVRYGEGAYRFRRHGDARRSFEPLGFYAALVRQGFARGVRVGALVCAAQVATAVGFVRAWGTLRREQRVTTASTSPRNGS